MNFPTPGEKIKRIRKQLGMIQQDLEDVKLKRNFVSMIENGDRNPSRETAKIIARKFNERARRLNLDLVVDENFLLATPAGQAADYCNAKLNNASHLSDFDEIITVAESYGLERHQLDAYVKMGDLCLDSKCFREGFIHYLRALDLCKNLQDSHKQSMIFNKLGLCKLNDADYIEALEYFNKAYNYSKASKDNLNMEKAVYNVMLAYRKLERHARTIEYADLYLSLANSPDNERELILTLLIKADALIGIKSYDEAKEILIRMLIENKDSKDYFGYIYNEIGNVHLSKKEYTEAIKYYNMAQEMVEKYDIAHIHANLIDRAHLYAETSECEESIKLLQQGILLAEKHGDNQYLTKGFRVLETLCDKGLSDQKIEPLMLRFLELVEKLKPQLDKRDVCTRLSLIHLNRNDLEQAKEYLRLSLI